MVVSVSVDSEDILKLVDVQTGVLAIAKALEVNGELKTLSQFSIEIIQIIISKLNKKSKLSKQNPEPGR